jgi:cytochrome c oxidase subunit 2
VDGTNVNLMALPGVVNYAQARFERPGRHPILCHEYCGVNHAQMHGEVEVVEAAGPERTSR